MSSHVNMDSRQKQSWPPKISFIAPCWRTHIFPELTPIDAEIVYHIQQYRKACAEGAMKVATATRSRICGPDPRQLRMSTSIPRPQYWRQQQNRMNYLVRVRSMKFIVVRCGKIPHSI